VCTMIDPIRSVGDSRSGGLRFFVALFRFRFARFIFVHFVYFFLYLSTVRQSITLHS
jgi:hypothetical protein